MKYIKNPWKRLSSRLVYQNSWIRLREDKVVAPSGKEGIYGVVEAHPAIGIVPLTEDGQTYLVGQFRYTLGVYSWEIPEGGGHPGESTWEGARRELLEETGLVASQWTYLGSAYTSNSFTNEVAYLYLAEKLTQKQARPDHTEELEIVKLPFKKAWEMVQNGTIKDAMSIIALLRVKEILDDRGLF